MSDYKSFIDCCKNGDLENAKLLVTKRNKQKGFNLSCENGHIKIAKWLYSLGVDINQCLFRYVCKNGHIEIAKWLHSLGVNSNIDFAFRCAFFNDHVEINPKLL